MSSEARTAAQEKKFSLAHNQGIIIVLILALIMIVLSIMTPEFLTYTNIMNVVRQVAMTIIAGSAVTILMIAGGMDLSVGSIIAFSGLFFIMSEAETVFKLPIQPV